jgi:hypothetical protein
VDENNGGSSASLRKLEANRRNAQKSTGPRSVEGKRNSRWNAAKHGILAVDLLALGPGAEDAKEFEVLADALWSDLAPVGKLEEILVDRIAVCIWRQKRAIRCEAGVILRELYRHQEDVTGARLRNGVVLFSQGVSDHLSLPDAINMDRILRYETTIQRQLDRTLDQLERLQRSRKGEHVPAPVTVQLSSDQ